MPRKKNMGGSNLPAIKPIRDIGRAMRGGTDLVTVEAVFHVPDVHPVGLGPWSGEADKIAWTDRMSGFSCIIKRSPRTGCLEAYVGVDPEHPLFGVTKGALVGLDLRVHGGVNYAAGCQTHEPEPISICHVYEEAERTLRSVRPHDDAWWIGFSCDQAGDLIPTGRNPLHGRDVTAGVNERVYRNEAYVYRECIGLAAQLRAIADGVDHRVLVPRKASIGAYDSHRVRD